MKKPVKKPAKKAVKKAVKASPGRKLLPIDPKVVEGMASVGGTDQDIADFVGCSAETIRVRFLGITTKSRASLRMRLRQIQIKLALEGNVTMGIWLGKQMLGQSDRHDLAHSVDRSLADILTSIAERERSA